jgi:hypothetical protein
MTVRLAFGSSPNITRTQHADGSDGKKIGQTSSPSPSGVHRFAQVHFNGYRSQEFP